MRKIGVIGIGKLGLCLALQLERAGCEVIGIDRAADYVAALNARTFRSAEPLVNSYLLAARHFSAGTELQAVIRDDIDTLFILVATPSTDQHTYDHGQIDRVAADLAGYGRRSREIHLVVGCTTMPGYCDQLAQRLSELNYTVSYSPEFIAQGSIMQDMMHPDLVLIGSESRVAAGHIQALYERICANHPPVHHLSRLEAEICKLAINCFLTTKIAFANAIGDLALAAGCDPGPLLAAVGSDTRIGSAFLRYGFGFGGPCLPRDNRALGHFAGELGHRLDLSSATDEANRRHLDFQLQQYLRQYDPAQPIEFGSVTYKPSSLSIEESQQLALAEKLALAGRQVCIRERPEVIAVLRATYGNLFTYKARDVQTA